MESRASESGPPKSETYDLVMYEHKSQPILSPNRFAAHFRRVVAITGVVIVATLLLGATGFCLTHRITWFEGLHHAAWLTPMKTL